MRKSPSLRSLAIVVTLMVIFGGWGAIFFGALDEAQTGSTARIFSILVCSGGYVSHFFSAFAQVVTTGTQRLARRIVRLLLQGIATTLEFCFLAMPSGARCWALCWR